MCFTLAIPLFSGKEGAGTESASPQPWPWAQWLGFYGVGWQQVFCDCCILYVLAWCALHFSEVMTSYLIHPQPGYYSWAVPTGETATPPAESSLDERGGSIICLPWEKLREKGPHSNLIRGDCPALHAWSSFWCVFSTAGSTSLFVYYIQYLSFCNSFIEVQFICHKTELNYTFQRLFSIFRRVFN